MTTKEMIDWEARIAVATAWEERVTSGEVKMHLNGHKGHTKELALSVKHRMILDGAALPYTKESSYAFSCCECDKRPSIVFEEDKITFEDNHVDETYFTIDLEVPSGKLLYADYLNVPIETGDFNVNSTNGIRLCSEAHAKQGMMHFFVSNSCPAVAKVGNQIEIGSLFDYDDKDCDESTNVGSICTDLWWVSFMDYDHYLAKHRESGASPIEIQNQLKGIDVLEVTPGTYRCTSFYHIDGDQRSYEEDEPFKKQVYCRMELIK